MHTLREVASRATEGEVVVAGARSDPRFRRVRERLIRVILDMAGSRPPESISVSELTTAAGVSRAVFYAHATSPAPLLADALIAEIEPSLQASLDQLALPNADYVALWRQICSICSLSTVGARGGVPHDHRTRVVVQHADRLPEAATEPCICDPHPHRRSGAVAAVDASR
jgi:AcrR family transcriptional regulator